MNASQQRYENRLKRLREMCSMVVNGEKKMTWLRSHLRSDGEVKFAMKALARLAQRQGIA